MAVNEIGVADSAFETGQSFFAASASSLYLSAVALGTLPSLTSWIAVIVQPASCFSMLTVAVVRSSVGSKPALDSWALSAIVKQLACAAAISSSGLVPARPSSDMKRVCTLYGCALNAPLCVVIVPLPCGTLPCQMAVLFRLSMRRLYREDARVRAGLFVVVAIACTPRTPPAREAQEARAPDRSDDPRAQLAAVARAHRDRPIPAWERWTPSDAVFARDPRAAAGALAFRRPHDISMAGRVVVPASQPQLYYVLLDDAAVAHVRGHALDRRASIAAAGPAIAPFPHDARAAKLVWFPVRARGTTNVPVWDPGDAPATFTSWPRTVAVSMTAAPGTISVDRFYHRSLATPAELAAARLAWHDDGLAPGDVVVLVAVHLTTKEVPDWTWTTLWWHDRADAGPFAADRPSDVTGWAASYVMDATLDGGAPCANPWLEGRFPDGLASNCVSCHAARGTRRGRVPAGDERENTARRCVLARQDDDRLHVVGRARSALMQRPEAATAW